MQIIYRNITNRNDLRFEQIMKKILKIYRIIIHIKYFIFVIINFLIFLFNFYSIKNIFLYKRERLFCYYKGKLSLKRLKNIKNN